MNPLRVAIVADYAEEGWASMDLVADMLMDRLTREHASRVRATLVRPAMTRRAGRLPGASRLPAAFTADRFTNRLWDYPRLARRLAADHDVFHIVDHSYAQLVHGLPAARTLVTCHDVDTFRSILHPDAEPRSAPFRAMTRHILAGVRKAGHVACDTEATRQALIVDGRVDPERTSVVPNGPHPSCTPEPEPAADVEAARVLGPHRPFDLLHVGTTIARKRIDVLLRVFAGVKARFPQARLVRVGGPFSAAQRALARELAVERDVVVLPFLDRATLASVYRRSAIVLLPSEREGFGLPLLEALACGTPVIASDLDALREVGAAAVVYCPADDVEAWVEAVSQAIAQRQTDPAGWERRRRDGIDRAAAFSWSQYAAEVAALYERLARGGAAAAR